ncbi:MAG: hypothetical protein GWP91_16715 [Rhodobacterales bacterium]|nr:hypothetical protein [Rhodobacterales bacterium]
MLTSMMFLLLACGGGQIPTPPKPAGPPPIPSEEAWSFVHQGVIEGAGCYLGSPRYCLRNSALVTAQIQGVLDQRYDGIIPDRRRDLADVIRRGQTAFKAAQFSEEHIRQVELVVDLAYREAPVKVVEGKGITVLLGAPPGALQLHADGKKLWLSLDSLLVKDDELSTAELVRVIRAYTEKYPDAAAVQLKVTLPQGLDEPRKLDYRYLVERKQLVVRVAGQEGEAWRSPVIEEWKPYRFGQRSLAMADLAHCTEDETTHHLICDEP